MKAYWRLWRKILPILCATHLAGCATNGYITSHVGTIVGLDVSENPKSQVPHVRFGYARNGMYYVPTGKTGNMTNGSAAETPNVVSEIFVNSKFMSSMTISEKFAIGPGAVNSDAATQAFANNSAQAVAANGIVESRVGPATDFARLPPRGSDTKVSLAKVKENEAAAITGKALDELRRPGATAVKTLEDEAKGKGKKVDYAKLIKAITGEEPSSATRADYLNKQNSINRQDQIDALTKEVIRQQEDL